MQYKIKLVFLLLIGNFIFSDSIKYNNPNNHGVVGLINIPTARFYNESSAAFTAYRGDPDRKITLTLMPFDWVEASLFYTSIKGVPYGNGFNQDYKDKGFNAKFLIKEEDNLPAIAIGFNDIAGTGYYSSEYIVGSYGIENIDMSLGMGWGRLSGGRLQYDNFFRDIDRSFLIRDSDVGQGGELNIDNYFSGKEMAIFGGISYLMNDEWLFKFEYDSTDIPLEIGFPERSSNYSFGLEYIDLENLAISLNFERGDYFGLKFSWKGNFSKYITNPYRENNSIYKDSFSKLKSLLNTNSIGVDKIERSEKSISIDLYENSYTDLHNLRTNVEKAVVDSGFDIEQILITYNTAGLEARKEKNNFDSENIINLESIYSRDDNKSFTYSPDLVLRPFIAGREDFLKVALMAELNTQYIFNKKLFWSTNFKYALWQNFDDLYIPPVYTYPNQVRSDVKDYLNNFGNRIILGRSQLDYFDTFFEDHHIQISAGIFEEMFSGYGIEYLWSKYDLPLSIGFEAFEVYKRDYDLAFGLLDYSNTTGHINFYYENEFLLPLSFHLSYGEYLAGDKGYTFDVSRRFSNGVIMGGFFTKTDVTREQFGEGSFDKGIYFKIPIYGDWFNSLWRPLTKDPGAKLLRKDNLYGFLQKYKD
tara:strand:+ start:16583 stop:18514 length:1932 start_codon:yes stop_codon:yes gene_type:complete